MTNDHVGVCVNLQGELDEHEKLVAAIKQADIVISVLAIPQHLEQYKIINAIKEAGNIKVQYNFQDIKSLLFYNM